DLRGALFMVANSKTRRIENERFPVGEAPEPVWSPNGNRIAILRNTDLWTIEPDGDNPVRLTHSGRVGGVVWSPDSETIAYTYTPMHMTRWGRQPDVPNVYVRSASGGPAHR